MDESITDHNEHNAKDGGLQGSAFFVVGVRIGLGVV